MCTLAAVPDSTAPAPAPPDADRLLLDLSARIVAGDDGALRDASLTDGQRDFLLLRVDANLRGLVGLLDEYRPLLERAQTRVTRFGRK